MIKRARANPLDASYWVDFRINGAEYSIQVLLEKGDRVVAVQAHQIYREEYAPSFLLITDSRLLFALLELVIHQGIS